MFKFSCNFLISRFNHFNINHKRFNVQMSSSWETVKYIKSAKYKGGLDLPPSKYGGKHFVTMLPGHGIGPEVMKHVKDVFSVLRAPVDFEIIDMHDRPDLIEDAITSIRRNGCCIKGNIDPSEQYNSTPNVEIRKKLGLYANLTICKSYKNIPCKHDNIDIILIRQNTEGEYSMMEHEGKEGIVESMKITTAYNSKRIAQWALNIAKSRNRKKVTIIHKANILKMTDGLFLRTAKKVCQDYPEIKVNDMIIDKACKKVITNPHQFDVIISPNLYGTILSNIICGLMGGAGLKSGASYGDHYAVFETATRSQAKAMVGLNIANPIATLNSAVDLLDYLHLFDEADYMREAIRKTIEDDHVLTADLGGRYTTTDVIDQIKQNILEEMRRDA